MARPEAVIPSAIPSAMNAPDLAPIVAIRRDIHAHPELCFEEVRTADVIARTLEGWGIEVHRGLGRTGVVGTFQDITERKQAEATVRDSEARFRLLSETAGRLLGAEDPQDIVNELCRDVMEHLDCQTCFHFLLDEGFHRCHGLADVIPGVQDDDVHTVLFGGVLESFG